MKCSLKIDMAPVAKGRARVAVRGGRAMAYTPSKTVEAEERIRWQFRQANLEKVPEGVPLTVYIRFCIQRPKSCPKMRVLPVVKPDLDNLEKLVMDALNGFAWHDDAQIIEKHSLKVYIESEPYIQIEWGWVS